MLTEKTALEELTGLFGAEHERQKLVDEAIHTEHKTEGTVKVANNHNLTGQKEDGTV